MTMRMDLPALTQAVESRVDEKPSINWRQVFVRLLIFVPLVVGYMVGYVVVGFRYMGSAFVVGYREVAKPKPKGTS